MWTCNTHWQNDDQSSLRGGKSSTRVAGFDDSVVALAVASLAVVSGSVVSISTISTLLLSTLVSVLFSDLDSLLSVLLVSSVACCFDSVDVLGMSRFESASAGDSSVEADGCAAVEPNATAYPNNQRHCELWTGLQVPLKSDRFTWLD